MAKKAAEAEQEALKPGEEAASELDSVADEAAPQADDEGAPDLQAALEAAQDEVASLKDAALRAQADVENMRRRAARDVENAHKFALERFAESLLPVIDSLEKSVESAAEAADAAVSEGVGLCLKLFLDTLARNGIEQVDPLGEPFDPSRSEAMAMVENPDAEPNSVMEVMQKGYALNGRLVRAAKVIVAKAPAAAAPAD
ncbi:MAG: nucleotide exchange factor GrpE [Gammaproteobacteria bacterium]|nr:nucleotide exchange factor GrpE [Gammaproteobacteria bacterium]MYH14615.1 nucleotide exchange factor GrpE [Gammaproteobacteria bacterium]MYK82165.1 nucleotide exchange factor GrpE [Gammaproteobacteria bacterium]